MGEGHFEPRDEADPHVVDFVLMNCRMNFGNPTWLDRSASSEVLVSRKR
jgi:hypothetical protein